MVIVSAVSLIVTLVRFSYALNTIYFIKAIGMGLVLFIPGRYLIRRHYSKTIKRNNYVFRKAQTNEIDRIMLLIILGLVVTFYYSDFVYHAVYKHGWPSTALAFGMLSLSLDSYIYISKLENKLRE